MTKYSPTPSSALKNLALSALAAGTVLLTGCASLKDEHYSFCDNNLCKAPVMAPVAAAAPTPAPVVPTPAPAAVVAPAVVVAASERITLNADALFQFDRSSTTDILPQGKAALDSLVNTLKARAVSLQRIVLTGHTDRLGSEAYNQRLAQARVETVRGYLQTAGVSTPMEITAKGESEPVTTDCKGNQATPALVSCLQPDRRVTVDMQGLAQKK